MRRCQGSAALTLSHALKAAHELAQVLEKGVGRRLKRPPKGGALKQRPKLGKFLLRWAGEGA